MKFIQLKNKHKAFKLSRFDVWIKSTCKERTQRAVKEIREQNLALLRLIRAQKANIGTKMATSPAQPEAQEVEVQIANTVQDNEATV